MELFDEEIIHTTQAERWENYGTLNIMKDIATTPCHHSSVHCCLSYC